jgi:hypothetical protein
MQSLTSALLFAFAASAAACGGQVDDSAPASKTGSNGPSNAPVATGCAGACDRFRECVSSFDDRGDCVKDCGRDLPDPARAAGFATCLQALSCESIQRGMTMSYGPIGECYAKARGR